MIDVRALAEQAGNWKDPDYLTRFARLVLEAAAKECEKRRDARFDEHGTRDYDVNVGFYSGPMAEIYESLDEEDEACAERIRRLAPEEGKPGAPTS